MSQPSLSRLENTPSWRALARMGLSMIDLFCDSFARGPQRIVLDVDDTDDAVHGGQQLALFNAHYDEYCSQPLHIFEAATGKPRYRDEGFAIGIGRGQGDLDAGLELLDAHGDLEERLAQRFERSPRSNHAALVNNSG